MNAICIIPARGGSKGIPRKNMLPLAGKPLVGWSIEQAIAAGLPTIVTTDDDGIAEYSRSMGAMICRRPAHLAADDSPSETALLHAMRWWLDGDRPEPEAIVFLQPTSPVRQPHDIEQAMARMLGADSVVSVRYLEGYTWRTNGILAIMPEYEVRHRRQDKQYRQYEENGSIYIFRPWVLEKTGNRFAGRINAYVMHPLDSFQLDSIDDVPLIECLLKMRCQRSSATLTGRSARIPTGTMSAPSRSPAGSTESMPDSMQATG